MAGLIEKHVAALHRGDMKWPEFERITRSEWTALANKLMTEHPLPGAVQAEDVRQELLIWAWRFLLKWTEDGGQPLFRFVVIGATWRTRRWLAGQRNSYRRCTGAGSRLPVRLETFLGGSNSAPRAPSYVPHSMRVDPPQGEHVEKVQLHAAARAATRSLRDRQLVAAFLDAGDVDRAVARVCSDHMLRWKFRFEDAREVRRAMTSAIRHVTTKIEEEYDHG